MSKHDAGRDKTTSEQPKELGCGAVVCLLFGALMIWWNVHQIKTGGCNQNVADGRGQNHLVRGEGNGYGTNPLREHRLLRRERRI